jgi:two-component system, OmpR family, response regulator ResD
MMKLLIVENEPNIASVMVDFFTELGHEVRQTGDGFKAIQFQKDTPFDVVILDIMLDASDGWSVCRTIKKTSTTKVIIVSARHQEEDKLFGFELGADDYLAKPFSLKELQIRVDKLSMLPNVKYQVRLEIEDKSRSVKLDGKLIKMTKTEFDVLYFLSEHPLEVISRERLLSEVWGFLYEGDTRTVDTTIKRIRQKLAPLSCIHTVFGVGYQFEVIH